MVERFVAAVTASDVQGLMDVLAPNVVLLADGGGIAQAVLVPVVGARKVVNLLRPFPAVSVNPAIVTIRLNGALGIRIDDEVGGTTIVSLVVEDGRITQIFAMRNPDKLARLDQVAELTR